MISIFLKKSKSDKVLLSYNNNWKNVRSLQKYSKYFIKCFNKFTIVFDYLVCVLFEYRVTIH